MSAYPMRRPYGEIQARAARTARRWRGAARPRGERARVRLWLPLSALFVLLSPFALLLALIAFLPASLFGVNSLAVAYRLGVLLMSISGTLVEVEAADASVRIKIV